MAPISPQDIVNMEFREAFRGYNENDVDNFLDEVAEEYARLYQENQRAKIQIASLQQEISRAGDRPHAEGKPKAEASIGKAEAREEMKRALVATQRAAEAALEEAKRRAAEIIARAEQRAGEIDDLIARRAKDVDSDAATALEHAQTRVEELRRQESELRTRLRRLLADHVRALQALEVEVPAEGRIVAVAAPGEPTAEEARAAVVERMAQDLGDAAETTPSPAPAGEFWKP